MSPGWGGDDDRLAREGRHGHRDSLVVAHAALHEDLVPGLAEALHPVHIIDADRIHQAGQDVLLADPFLGGGVDVAGDEGGALVAEVRRVRGAQGQGGDVFHLDAHRLEGRFLEKAAGTRRTRLVHGVVRSHTVGQERVLGVLAADFEDGVDLGVEVGRGPGVGDDLVDDALGTRVEACQVPARPCHPYGHDLDLGRPDLVGQGLVTLAAGLDGIAVGPQVPGAEDLLVGKAEEHGLGRGRAHVEAHSAFVAVPGGLERQVLELDPIGHLRKGSEELERRFDVLEVVALGDLRGQLVLEGVDGGAQGLEARSVVGNLHMGNRLAEEVDDHAVLGRAANHEHLPGVDAHQKLLDLFGDHSCQTRGHIADGLALIQGVGAVALAEHRAAARQVVGVGALARQVDGFVHVDVHPPDLLEEELSGTRGALVPRTDPADFALLVHFVDDERFSARGNDGVEPA